MSQWKDSYAFSNPEYAFVENHEGLRGFVAVIVKQYLLEHETDEAPVSFDDPAFREAVQASLDHREALKDMQEMKSPIIMTYHQYLGAGPNDSDMVISIPLPALDEDSPHMISAYLEVLVLNPLSKHKAEALDFVAFYARQLDAETEYALNESLNTPLCHKDFEKSRQEQEEYMRMLEEKLRDAPPEEKPDLKAKLDEQKRLY